VPDEWDKDFEPWELEDMRRLRQGLEDFPFGGSMYGVQPPTNQRTIMPQLGTDEEISAQEENVLAAERAVMEAKLRLRALRGVALMQSGDSFPMAALNEALKVIEHEFGARNLRIM
jgi:hypothetical protein